MRSGGAKTRFFVCLTQEKLAVTTTRKQSFEHRLVGAGHLHGHRKKNNPLELKSRPKQKETAFFKTQSDPQDLFYPGVLWWKSSSAETEMRSLFSSFQQNSKESEESQTGDNQNAKTQVVFSDCGEFNIQMDVFPKEFSSWVSIFCEPSLLYERGGVVALGSWDGPWKPESISSKTGCPPSFRRFPFELLNQDTNHRIALTGEPDSGWIWSLFHRGRNWWARKGHCCSPTGVKATKGSFFDVCIKIVCWPTNVLQNIFGQCTSEKATHRLLNISLPQPNVHPGQTKHSLLPRCSRNLFWGVNLSCDEFESVTRTQRESTQKTEKGYFLIGIQVQRLTLTSFVKIQLRVHS